MATHPNRLAVTQVPIFPSPKSPPIDIQELGTQGERGYKVRSEDELSQVELLYLNTLDDHPTAKKMIQLDFATIFKGPKAQLAAWPLFYRSKEESSIELQQGLVTLWSNFLIAEVLLATISIQPLVTVPNLNQGWPLKLYGFTWMVSIISGLWCIAITFLFLGFLVGCPNTVAWKWMCEISLLRSVPTVLILPETSITLAAIACTCWLIYGHQIGIMSIVMALVFFSTMYKLQDVLFKAREKVIIKDM